MQPSSGRLVELRRRFFTRAAWWLVISIGAFVLIAALTTGLKESILRRTEDRVRQNLNEIRLALDAWADEHGGYPERAEVLLRDGYLAQFLNNPFTGKPMEHIELGQPAKPGCFTYYAQPLDDTMSSAPDYAGYCLVAYGRRRSGSRTPLEAQGAFPELNVDGNQVIVRHATSIEPIEGVLPPLH